MLSRLSDLYKTGQKFIKTYIVLYSGGSLNAVKQLLNSLFVWRIEETFIF